MIVVPTLTDEELGAVLRLRAQAMKTRADALEKRVRGAERKTGRGAETTRLVRALRYRALTLVTTAISLETLGDRLENGFDGN